MFRRSSIVAPLADAVCIGLFVLGGRQSHDLGGGLGWELTVAWPFWAGWFGAALALGSYWHSFSWPRQLMAGASGVGLGLLLRVAFTGRPAPVSFAIVALLIIGGTTIGWRLVCRLLIKRRQSPRRSPLA